MTRRYSDLILGLAVALMLLLPTLTASPPHFP